MASETTVRTGGTPPAGGLSALSKNSDIILAVIMVAVVVMMILPIPAMVLDFLLVVNITSSLLMLLLALYVVEPVSLNTFPTLLLLLTLFRLALNVSTTRVILLDADHVPKVVEAFGKFVIGGNYVVGLVVFLILVIIQFVVITNGAGRISEVSARFTLDAMPGKQMAIDADLNSGLIQEQEAKQRRQAIQREADFYGTMDGASKFVRGDAVAGLVITAINLVGGIVIGVLQQGRPLADAASRYTVLSIGDGLISQIPALLISTGTGILVSRAASDTSLGATIAGQITASPRPLVIAAAMLAFLAAVPGLPGLPFVMVGSILGGIGYALVRQERAEAAAAASPAATEDPGIEASKGPENVMALLKVDAMELEVGYRLIPLVDTSQGGDLLERITMIRRQMALKLGLVIPPIRVRDNLQIKPKEYRINLRGIDIARGEVQVDHFLAMDSGLAMEAVPGIATVEPVFGLPATWITEDYKEQAEMAGYTVFDVASVIATHLMEVLKAHAPEILTRADTQALLDNLKQDQEALVAAVVPDLLQVSDIQHILQNLLRDRVSIRDLVPVMESLETHARLTKDIDTLTEYARLALARSICKANLGGDGALAVLTLDPELEAMMAQSIQQTDQGAFVSLEPGMAGIIRRNVRTLVEQQLAGGVTPVVLCSSKVRLVFRRLIERDLPQIQVMAYNEVVPTSTEVRAMGVIRA
ncbi:MAG: flagellar biosynthesis protein FlhA [Candidatus Sericytochromatia bacterium]|nr:flagellar biosynthesis protein FlhA [Candidatus Sericytochromatia bacterium]